MADRCERGSLLLLSRRVSIALAIMSNRYFVPWHNTLAELPTRWPSTRAWFPLCRNLPRSRATVERGSTENPAIIKPTFISPRPLRSSPGRPNVSSLVRRETEARAGHAGAGMGDQKPALEVLRRWLPRLKSGIQYGCESGRGSFQMVV